MQGYIISFTIDHIDGQRTSYWTGNGFAEDVVQSQFFTNIIEARQLAASLQSQYVDRTVNIISAKNGVHF